MIMITTQPSPENRKKRESASDSADSTVISINYDKYTSSPSEVSSWAEVLPSGSGITVKYDKADKTYSVREMNSKGRLRMLSSS